MTDLRKLLAEATPGPWEVDYHGIDDCLGDVWLREDERICENATAEDARLIALAPQLAAALIKAKEALIEINASAQPDRRATRHRHCIETARAALSEISALTGGRHD